MRRRRTRVAICAVGLVLAGASQGRAEEMRLVLDPDRTEITFELGATLHTVHGGAELREGEIRFDSGGGAAEGRIVAAAPSADTGNDKRDRDMHQKVLESERFSEIVFVPSRVDGEVAMPGRSTVDIVGTFSIHGEDHPLTVEATVEIDGEALEATLEFDVPYVEWGMKDPSKFLLKVAKEVTVRIHAFGSLAPAP